MLKSISVLFILSAVAQLIQLVVQPILANMLEPSEFSLLGKILALAAILVIAGNLQIHNCLIVTDSSEERKDLFAIGVVWLSVYSVAVVGMQLLTSELWERPATAGCFGIFLGVAIWVAGTTNLLAGYYSASRDFRHVGYLSVQRAILVSVAQYLMSWVSFANSLVVGLFTGELLVRLLNYSVFKDTWRRFSVFRMKQLFLKYRAFTFTGTVQESVSVIALMAPLYYFGERFGDHIGGNYAFAYRMAWAPGMLIASSVSSILLKNLASKQDWEIRSEVRWLPVQSLVIFVLAYLLLRGIILVVVPWLNMSWADSVGMMQWVSLWVAMYLAALKARQLFRVFHLQKWQLAIDLFIVCGMLLTFHLPGLSWSDALFASSVLGVFQNIIMIGAIVVIIRSSGLNDRIG